MPSVLRTGFLTVQNILWIYDIRCHSLAAMIKVQRERGVKRWNH